MDNAHLTRKQQEFFNYIVEYKKNMMYGRPTEKLLSILIIDRQIVLPRIFRLYLKRISD